MGVIISDVNNPSYDGNLSTTNGFYRVEAFNINFLRPAGANLSLATTRTIPVTFANAGNCQGIVLGITPSTNNTNRSLVVTLQENVNSVWTNRASVTISADAITNSVSRKVGHWIIPCTGGTFPYPVTTESNKWQFSISQTGGTTGDLQLRCSDSSNPAFATWCDNAVSFSSGNDAIIVKDRVVIDMTAQLKAYLGTGTTDMGVCGVICRNTDPSAENVATLVWQNPPSASYTLTLDGFIQLSAHSGFRAGTSSSRIPANCMGTITCVVPTAGSDAPSGFRGLASDITSGSALPSKASFFIFGEIPPIQKTTLAATANAGQKVIITTEATGWASGDKIAIGKSDAGSGSGDTTIYTIDTISGTTITFTTNLATKRLAGASVFRMNGYGFKMVGLNNAQYNFIAHYLCLPSHYVISGCEIQDASITFGTGNTSINSFADDTTNCSQYRIEDISARNTGSVLRSTFSGSPNEHGLNVQRIYTCYSIPFNVCYGASSPVMSTGLAVIHDCVAIAMNYASLNCTSTSMVDIHDCSFENGAPSGWDFPCVLFQGTNCSMYRNYFYAHYYALAVGALYKPLILGQNTYDRCTSGIYFRNNNTTGCIEKNSTFGKEFANTNDISFAGINSAAVDYELDTPTGITTIDETNRILMLPGSQFKISNYNNTANDNRIWSPHGYIRSTGTGLTDATVRTAGGYAMRFQPTSGVNPLVWSFNVPTGNIQNKTMTVAVWVKINNSAYYAGTHQKPRLSVNYDNGTVVSSTAVDSTDWQLLAVTFTPATVYGQITVAIDGRTNAAGSNAFFYVDDFSILYPAGHTLNLGSLDIWANALPVVPPISTVLSAKDVWTASKTENYGVDTMGEKLKSLKNRNILLGPIIA